jgi:hypothetical protein
VRGFHRKVGCATDWVPFVAGVLATVPLVVATVHAIDVGWTPSSDDGMVALRAFDVLSEHPPLVGQYSQSSPLIHETTYTLGPMLYWLLAVPAHVGPRAIPLAMGAVNVASVVGSVVLAGRRGGRPLAIAAALGLALVARALPVEVPYEIWNCWAGVFPFTFLLFVAWSVSCGDHRLLPLLAVTASYVVQIHFTYLVPALAATVVAVMGLLLYARGRPRLGLRPWVIVAVVATLVCWSGPLIEQADHRPGNLALAYRLATGDHRTAGLETGLRTAARAIGVPPWWAKDARTPTERVLEPLHAPTGSAVSALLLVALLLAFLRMARRGGQHDLSMAIGLALLLVLSIVVVGAAIPLGTLGLTALGYVLVWTVPAGMWVWLTLAWSAWLLLPALQSRIAPRRGFAVGAGLAAVAVLAALVAAGRDYDDPSRLPPGLKDYRLVESTADRVREAVAGSHGVLLDAPIEARHSLTFQSAIAYAVRREGLPIGVPERLAREMGRQYRAGAGAYDQVISIRDGDAPPIPGGRTIVRNHAVTVMITPWTRKPSRSPAP